MPKNRDNIYLVERKAIGFDNSTVICAAFGGSEAAYNYADAAAQEFIDKGLEDEFSFDVVITTYYSE